MTYRIGIDPGVTGAVVVLAGEKIAAAQLMPSLKIGKSSRVNGAALAAFLRPWLNAGTALHAYLEQVHAMPGQGVTSMFTFGHSAGVAEGILLGLGIP